MLNEFIAMGRFTANPELKETKDNHNSVVSFTLAVQRDDTSKENAVDFISVEAWGTLAEFIAKHFKKGKAAIVMGRLKIDQWTDKNGVSRKTAKIVANKVYFADKKEANPMGVETDEDVPFGEIPEGVE